jgi:peptide-methionine (S)-S-oxide reductase
MMKFLSYALCLQACFAIILGCAPKTDTTTPISVTQPSPTVMPNDPNMETVTLGAGCFWCVEAMFQRIEGVKSVVSGYSGGPKPNPTYKEVCSGTTGHAEVCQVTFDQAVIPFEAVLEVFFKTHDPTTLNRQGADVGTQYRSAIFYHTEAQKKTAETVIRDLNAQRVFPNPIVTEVTAFERFYPAEDYHQDYYALNGGRDPYCRAVILPKVEKLEKYFKDRLKKQ